jgi:chromosome segregation ATPase
MDGQHTVKLVKKLLDVEISVDDAIALEHEMFRDLRERATVNMDQVKKLLDVERELRARAEKAEALEELATNQATTAANVDLWKARTENAEQELFTAQQTIIGLEGQVADLREKVDLLTHVNAGLCAVLQEAGAPAEPANAFEMAAWAQGVAALRADKERLDWLENNAWKLGMELDGKWSVLTPETMTYPCDTARAAIDAAKAKQEGGAK